METALLPDAGAGDVLYLVDVSSYVYRAYFAIGHLSNSEGLSTNAVLGVTRMLQRLWRERKPAFCAVAMDSRTPTWRREVYPEYKANRPPPPPDLKEQIPVVGAVVEAYSIAVLQRDGFEADDVIATATRLGRAAGLRVVVVTGDKDLMQLVGDGVVVYDTMKDKVYGPLEVEEKFGVRPELLGDLFALMGDASDNIPGVPSVGPKTAAKLIGSHGSLEGVLAAAAEIKGKLGQTLLENVEAARLSRRLVALSDDVDVPFDLEKLRFGAPDVPRLRALLERLEFGQLLHELDAASGAAPPASPVSGAAAPPTRTYRTIFTHPELEHAVAEIRARGEVSVDLETTSVDPMRAAIVGISLSWKECEGWYVPVGHLYLGAPKQLPLAEVLGMLRPVLEDPSIRVYGQNFKYDDVVLRNNGVVTANVAFDTMMASYLLDSSKRSHGLDQLALDELGHRTITYDEVTLKKRGSQLRFDEVEVEAATEYSGEDAEIVFTLVKRLAPKVQKAGYETLLDRVELPLGRVLAEMEMAGVLVETKLLGELSRAVGEQLLQLETKAQAVAGHAFNLNSPQQLATILFDELGLTEVKKTKGKTARSTDVEVLTELARDHELPAVVLEHRQLAKLKGTYLDGLPKLVNPATGRIHTSYNQAVAATGRLSSSDPNLQNIPIRTDLGREIRKAFVAPPGHVLLAADYSQVELRVLAHLANDPLLIESFRTGEDVHARTAREIFGVAGEVSKEQRRRAKTINFGVVYGKTEFTLAKDLGITKTEAKQFINDYFARYAGVKTFMDAIIEEARRENGVKTLLGRRRLLPDIGSRNPAARQAAERMARNAPIQGTAADIMKIAMIRLADRLKREQLESRMVLTVHDELVLEVPEAERGRAEAAVVEVMSGAGDLLGVNPLKVPLVVDVGWGPTWAEAH